MTLKTSDCRLQVGVTLLAALTWVAPTAAETLDRVLAVVAGELITLTDVRAATEFGFVTPPAGGDETRAVLNALIDRELELAEVERYAPPEPSTADVDQGVAAVRARFPSDNAFTAALARAGVDAPHVRETVRDDLRIRAYLEQRFAMSDRRQQVIADWISGLRRRADIIDLYVAGQNAK